MGCYKYIQELNRKKQSDTMSFISRMRTWEFRQLPAIHRASRPSKPEKARKVGYKAKQGVAVFRVRIKRGGRKRRVAKGICYGKPSTSGVRKMKSARNLRSIAEERVGRKIGGLRVLNSYYVTSDAMNKWFEVVMVDPMHNAIRNDPRMNWICNAVHKHRELRGLTKAGKSSRGLLRKGKGATKKRPSMRSHWIKRNTLQLRRYR